jgi:hypothetical protein
MIGILGVIIFAAILIVAGVANYNIKRQVDHHRDDDINKKLPKGVL